MAGFAESLRNIWKIKELRERMTYTLLLLVIYRAGSYITLPGVDPGTLAASVAQQASTGMLGMLNLFVGGAFARAGVFALGIMPYITASIIVQLLGAVVPYFQKLQREGQDGQRKITQLTRYGTILITILQSVGFVINLKYTSGDAIVVSQWVFMVSSVITLTAGTAFVMWLGERITEDGIGNGTSLLILVGILAALPFAVSNEISNVPNFFVFLIEIAALAAITGAVVLMTQGTRRIPVQYAKRVVGRGPSARVAGGSTQYLPLRVNAAGVMPIIFAQSILFIPSTIASFFPESTFWTGVNRWATDPSNWGHAITLFVVCVFFTYFYTAIAVNPKDMADTMKRQGGFIPGIKPGKPTSDFIDNILTRITLPGSIFLGFVAILPTFALKAGVNQQFAYFFGGTSLLILVGVTLDTLQQIESHLLMRHYDGFMKTGRVRGRRV
ncbi:MAG: preprotein translocase subunit SecY [Bacteroidetes bacterium]|nr:preprotein translocase subunit SecY [Bacteroidota bacterium]